MLSESRLDTVSSMVTLLTDKVVGDEIPLAELKEQQRLALHDLKANRYVIEESVSVLQHEDGSLVVTFELQFDRPANIALQTIGSPEPIALRFSDETAAFSLAPKVLSNRADFPRNLPHQQPVPDDAPVEFCLSLQGVQAIYDRGGISALLNETARWLHDASAGLLNRGGWEPHPSNAGATAFFDGGFLQELGSEKAAKDTNVSTGIAASAYSNHDNNLEKVEFVSEECKLKDIEEAEPAEVLGCEVYLTPWVLLCSAIDEPVEDYFNSSVDTWEDLVSHCTQVGLADKLIEVLQSMREYNLEKIKSGIVLVLGVWRPQPIVPEIPGLAPRESDARRLELLAYGIRWQDPDNITLEHASVTKLRHSHYPSSDLRRFLSVNNIKDNIAIVGCGALGSKIADSLAREGCENLNLIDCDVFEPHNVARHVLPSSSLLMPKATALKEHLNSIGMESEHGHVDTVKNLLKMDGDELLGLFSSDMESMMIDATGSDHVFGFLSRFDFKDLDVRVVSTSILANGAFGVILIEGRGRNPRLDDLSAYLLAQSVNSDSVANWLDIERSSEQAGVMLGLGCASPTFQLGDHVVMAHAANTVAALHENVEASESGVIYLSKYSASGRVVSSDRFDAPGLREVLAVNESEWSIRILEDQIEKMRAHRANAVPNETGGYLYGTWDLINHSIVVTNVTDPPRNADGSPAGLELPPAGMSQPERELIAATSGRLMPVGTWHSHPGESAQPSVTDKSTYGRLVAESTNPTRPAAVLIIADEDIQALIGMVTDDQHG